MGNLPDKDKLLRNFSSCSNWEEKYLYIIELGEHLQSFPTELRTPDHLISGCQSQVWIVIASDINDNVQLYGDSDASIVKGLIATVFIFYQGLTPLEIIKVDISPFFNQLALGQKLTFSRLEGLEAMVRAIRTQATALL